MSTPQPGYQKTVECCGWRCEQGSPAPWECPGCHTVHVPEPEPPKGDDAAE